MSAKTDCRNHSRVLQDLRAVTLQEPQEDETRVDTVLGRESIKDVQWKWDFGKPRSRPYGLIWDWPSRHKTYRRHQPFRSARHWKLPRDVQPNEDSGDQCRLRLQVEYQGLNPAAELSTPAQFPEPVRGAFRVSPS